MKIMQGDRELYTAGHPSDHLIATGEELFSDKSLSGSGTTACSTCHTNGTGMMNATFAEPYPHYVAMAKEKAGMDEIKAAEMVQLCMDGSNEVC
jgi:cytochrome c peroxidase